MKRLAAMGAYRLSMYLKEEGTTVYWAQYPRLLDSEVTRELLDELEENYLESIAEETGSMALLYRLLSPEYEAGRLAWCCLELAVLHYMNSGIGEIYGSVHPASRNGATIALASKLLYGEAAVLDDYALLQEAFSRCELLLQAEYPVRQMGDALLFADDRLIQWMSDEESLLSHPFVQEGKLEDAASSSVWEEKQMELYREIMGGGEMLPSEMVVAALSGEGGSGRKYIAKQTAKVLGKPLLMVDMSYFGSLESLIIQWRKLLREVLLQPVLICVTGVEKSPVWETEISILVKEYEVVVKKAWELGLQDKPAMRPLFLITTANVKLIYLLQQRVLQKELPLPDLAQRAALWDFFAEKYLQGRKLPSQELAVKMKISLGGIEKVVKRLACLPQRDEIDSRTIFRYCYELLDDGRYDNIKRVDTKYTYDDLKLEESQKRIIMDICAQVEQRKKVLSDWNLQSRYSYGTSVSAIFSGPPGTGKTMAAHVMAGILGLELFKVDLSQIVDKYIGETEKRLEEVFQRAERSNMILFFDEADAIIGKRSETKEAKDKYANTEVAYLLQRMEEYDGIVILATNYSQNIDAAFMRRIRFTVHFPLPDEMTRKAIWQSAFAAETPVGYMDFDYLARQFEFSGGQIKNVVWNACFFAAQENRPVEMQHMVRAIQMELTKDKKVSFAEALGVYASLLY